LDKITEKWPVETVGALGYGERVFFALNLGDDKIAGEDVRQFFLLTEGKTGGHGITLAYTPIRVVCQNTLIAGLAEGTVTASFNHKGDVKKMLDLHVQLAPAMLRAQAAVKARMDAMALSRVTKEQVEEVLARAYIEPPRPKRLALAGLVEIDSPMGKMIDTAAGKYEAYVTFIMRRRDEARALYAKINDEFPKIAETPWAIYNAVVENEDFRGGGTKVPQARTSESRVYGTRAQAKVRAFEAASALVGAN
jgi:hypothetical protein